MGGFEAAAGLDEIVARMIVNDIARITRDVADQCKVGAPPTKVWTTVGDAAVRDSHRAVHGQEVPDNVRFRLRNPDNGALDLAQAPRDRALSPRNYWRCRCTLQWRDGIADRIRVTSVRADGSTVTGEVVSDHPDSHDAEFGTDRDRGARFMAGGIRAVAGTGQAAPYTGRTLVPPPGSAEPSSSGGNHGHH